MGVANRLLGVKDTTFLGSTNVRLVFLVSVVSSLGSVASPALPAMSATLGVSEARIGLVFTAFTLPAIFALPLVGIIADLFGRKAVIVPGLLLFGVAGTGVGLTGDFRLILFLRGAQGIGYTAFNSLTVALLGDLLSGAEESAAQGSRVIMNKLTHFVGPAAAGVLAGIAWYYPFYLYLTAIPVGVLIYFRFDDGVEGSADSNGDTETDDGRNRGLRGYAADIRRLVEDPFIAGVLAGGFFRMFMKYALYTFLSLAVVVQYNGSLGYAGLLVGVYSLIGAVVASQAARFTEGIGHSYALVIGFLIASAAYLAFPLAGGLVAVTALVLLHGVGEGIINPVHKSVLSQSVHTDIRAGLVTTNAIVQNTAKTITPIVLAPILAIVGSDAYGIVFFIAGGVTLVATGIAIILLMSGGLSESRHRLQAEGRGGH